MEIIIEYEQARVPVAIFRLDGRINLGSTGLLEQEVREAFEKGTRYLLLDLAKVPSITSAGLRTLQIINKLLASLNGTNGRVSKKSAHLKLLKPNPDLCHVLKLVGFDMIFDVYDTQEEAVKAF